jgi:hypothetical protein
VAHVPTHFAWSFVCAPATATAAAKTANPHILFNIARISSKGWLTCAQPRT